MLEAYLYLLMLGTQPTDMACLRDARNQVVVCTKGEVEIQANAPFPHIVVVPISSQGINLTSFLKQLQWKDDLPKHAWPPGVLSNFVVTTNGDRVTTDITMQER